MSARTMTPQAPAAPARGASFATTLPQVNLLPPEVRSARTLSRVKRWLLVAIGVTVVAIALLTGFAVLQEAAAQRDLEHEQQVAEQLLTEQLQYAEVPLVLGQLDRVKDARELGMSTEILWRDYLGALVAVTPEGVTIESVVFTGASPIEPAAEPSSVLVAPSVGVLTFSGRSATLPDTATWIDALDAVPGLRDASVQTAEINGSDGETYYEVVSTVQVDASAYTERFVVAPADAESTEEGGA